MNELQIYEVSNGFCKKILHKPRLHSCSLKTEQNGKWLRTSEVADYLGTSSGSIRNMVYRGQLVPKTFYRRHYFLREDIDRLIMASNRGGSCGD